MADLKVTEVQRLADIVHDQRDLGATIASGSYRVDGMVTHTYTLDEWQQGLTTASAGPKAQAVKVTLRPNEDLPLL